MNTETRSFVDVFFNHYDAYLYVEGHIHDHDPVEWELTEFEIKLMQSGAFRAGVVFKNRQEVLALFGCEEDA